MKNREQIAPASPKHLFICAGWPNVVMSLAYLDSKQDSGSHDFLILTDAEKSRADQEFIEIRQALSVIGHRQVDWLEAREAKYGELHLSPSYAMFSDDKRETDSISYKSLIVHADGLRNGIFVDHRLAPHVDGVAHYGFRLIEKSLLSTKLSIGLVENSHVVSYASISNTWHRLSSIFGSISRTGIVSGGDLLICERYWGSGHYQMREDAESGAYIRSVLRLSENSYKRVVFRPTTFHGTEPLRWYDEINQYAGSLGLIFTSWAEVFVEAEVAMILDHPEAQFFLGNLSELGGLYAFDGSLSVLVGSLSKGTKVHWADSALDGELFLEERIQYLVGEQGNWMREVSEVMGPGMDDESFGDFFTDGSTYKSVITELYLQNARAQLADKDAQLVDKDAQLADKDASLSWRITKPLRVVGKLLLPRKR